MLALQMFFCTAWVVVALMVGIHYLSLILAELRKLNAGKDGTP